MRPDKRNERLFSIATPILAMMVSMSLLLFPASQNYFNLRRLAQRAVRQNGKSASILIGSGNFQLLLPVESIPQFALNTAAMRVQGIVTLINAPGYLAYALPVSATGRSARWSPDGIFSGLWLTIMMPICAIPAWWFVGRGMDGYFKRRRLRLGDMIASLILLLGSATISAGLQFGTTAEERTGDEMSAWFITGFAWWSALFAIPLGIWLYQRTRAFRRLDPSA